MNLPINHRTIVRFFGTKRQKLVRQTQTPRYLEQFFEPESLPYNRMPGASNRVSRTKTPALKILNLKSRTGKFPGMRTFPETPPKLRKPQKWPDQCSMMPQEMRPMRFQRWIYSQPSPRAPCYIQQLKLLKFLSNDKATAFNDSDRVGNMGREAVTSSIVFLFFMRTIASAISSPAFGARMWIPTICLVEGSMPILIKPSVRFIMIAFGTCSKETVLQLQTPVRFICSSSVKPTPASCGSVKIVKGTVS